MPVYVPTGWKVKTNIDYDTCKICGKVSVRRKSVRPAATCGAKKCQAYARGQKPMKRAQCRNSGCRKWAKKATRGWKGMYCSLPCSVRHREEMPLWREAKRQERLLKKRERELLRKCSLCAGGTGENICPVCRQKVASKSWHYEAGEWVRRCIECGKHHPMVNGHTRSS